MSTTQILEHLSLAFFALGAAYLLYRGGDVLIRQMRSYRSIPYPTGDLGSREETTSRAVGAMIGVAVGDALGQFRESLPAWLCRVRYGRDVRLSRGIIRFGRRRGAITDDTQLTLAVARSIDEDGVFDAEHFRGELASWWKIRIGPGRATTKAVSRLRAGADEPGDAQSQGNGAAMRVVPLTLAHTADEPALCRGVKQSSKPTHADPEAIAGAQVAALVTLRCLESDRDDAATETSVLVAEISPCETNQPGRWETVLSRASRPAPDEDRLVENLRDIGTGGWVFESVPAAIHMLVSHPRYWRKGLRALFRVGGDVDTVASLYCSWVGALHGPGVFGELPFEIQGTGQLAEEASRIWATRGS